MRRCERDRRSRGLSVTSPHSEGRIEQFIRSCRSRIIAVTSTNLQRKILYFIQRLLQRQRQFTYRSSSD